MTTPADGGQNGGTGLASLPSPLDAVDDLRSAARWTIAAAGAVGAALISGGPLVAVGKIHGIAHALLAGAGLVVALAGVGVAIWTTTTVLTPQLTTPATLRSRELRGLRKIIEAEPAQFFGPVAPSIDALLLHREVAVNLALLLAGEKDKGRHAAIEFQLSRVERNAARAAPYVRWLLALGHVWQLKQALQRSRWFTFGGGVLVIAGTVLFFIATSSSGPT